MTLLVFTLDISIALGGAFGENDTATRRKIDQTYAAQHDELSHDALA